MSGSKTHVHTLKRHGKFDFVELASLAVTHYISNARLIKNAILMKASFSVAVPLTEEPVFRKRNKLRVRLVQNNHHGHWAIMIKNKFVKHFAVDTTCKMLSNSH
jgi:hypothetical protein